MTQEEKAKRYDDLLVKLQEAKVDDNVCDERYCCVIDNIVPELKESEDEKVCKEIKQFIRSRGMQLAQSKVESWIAWLEKQDEHKKFRDSIQVGDRVTRNEDGVLVNFSQLNRIAKKDEKQGEQKPAVIIPKFKVGDKIIRKELGGDFIHNPHIIIQVDMLDKKYRLKDGLVAHFSEEDDWELVEQKPAWSEEDESIALGIEQLCNCASLLNIAPDKIDKIKTWLKSLKDRIQPKTKQALPL